MASPQPIPGIHTLTVPTPYAVGPVNCYVLDGPEPVLVDCGPPTAEAEAALRSGLAALQIPVRDITRIVLTHHHPDHAGGLAWLTGDTDATIVGHPLNDLWITGRTEAMEARLQFFAALYRYCGMEEVDSSAMWRRFAGYEQPFAPRGIDMPIRHGDDIDLGGTPWHVLETPGHAGTSISLVRADGVALVGDTLLDRISSNALAEPPYPGQQGRTSSMLAYRNSLNLLADLPLGLVLPGHGPVFSNHRMLIARRLQGQEDRAQRLLAGLGPGRDTVFALSRMLFPGLVNDQLFLGLSEVLGHLDILEQQGRVRHSGDSPARYSVV